MCYAFDMAELMAKTKASMYDLDAVDLLSEKSWRESDYAAYGVDNEFDFVEALYREYSKYDASKLLGADFREMRIDCAMNPAYTERCLESLAFRDVRDEILARLGRV